VVILYFTALTVMLFTTLVYEPDHLFLFANVVINTSVGGIRYFSLVGILPAFHLFLECVDARSHDPGSSGKKLVPMAVQVVVLVQAVLVRNGAAIMIVAIAFGWLLIVWKCRREPVAIRRLLRKAVYLLIVATAFVGVLMLSVSKSYLTEGRFTETVWHRIFVSLGLSPAWPFGNLREIYDCTRYIPEGLTSGTEDRNGHCILWTYAIKHQIPPERVGTLTYSREYDAALREAFFNILYLYPVETLKTFAYYKSEILYWSIRESLHFRVSGIDPALTWLLVAALGNLIVFSLVQPPVSPSSRHAAIASATAALAGFSIIPYIAVWAMPHTTADLLLCCFFGLGLAAIVAVGRIRALLLAPSARDGARLA
jgi:hypothetical protein